MKFLSKQEKEKKFFLLFSLIFLVFTLSFIFSCSLGNSLPSITIIYPKNATYTEKVVELNYTASDSSGLSACWYSTDNGITNSTPDPTCSNFTNVISDEGSNTWIVYANDTLGNVNSASVTFTVDTGESTFNCLFFIIALFIITMAIIILGFIGQDSVIIILGAMGMIILGVYCLSNGICIYEDWMTRAISIVCIGVGIYILLKLAYNFLSFPIEEEE